LPDLQTQNPQNSSTILAVLRFQIEQIQPKSERQLEEVISSPSLTGKTLMTVAKLSQVDLFYREVGAGPPCLVMHGGLGLDHTCLHPWLDPLGRVLHLVYYDHRCNGRSGRPPINTLTFPQLCEDADALREHLGFDRIAVMGHSFGGFIGLEYALRYPQHLSHLILADTSPSLKYGKEILANALQKCYSNDIIAMLYAPPPANDAEMKRNFRTILPLYFHTYNAKLADIVFTKTTWSAEACRQSQLLMAEYDVSKKLNEIRVPTLIIAGKDDFICPVSQANLIHRGIPNSDLLIIEQAGHFPYVERPDAFFNPVLQWVRDH